MKSGGQVKVVWEEEEQTLTLEGEPVLTYKLAWPQVEGAGLGDGGSAVSTPVRRTAGAGGGGGRSTGAPVWSWSGGGRSPGPSPRGGGSCQGR